MRRSQPAWVWSFCFKIWRADCMREMHHPTEHVTRKLKWLGSVSHLYAVLEELFFLDYNVFTLRRPGLLARGLGRSPLHRGRGGRPAFSLSEWPAFSALQQKWGTLKCYFLILEKASFLHSVPGTAKCERRLTRSLMAWYVCHTWYFRRRLVSVTLFPPSNKAKILSPVRV